VSDVLCSVPRPPKELKAFSKIELRPGETRQVSVNLARSAFSFWSPTLKQWTVEPGTFFISAGSSSRDLRQTGSITVDH
jgi:beta-glucosidase